MKTTSDNDSICRSHFDDRVRRIVSVDKELSADYLDGVDMVLYLLSTEPTVPHEMTAREYERALDRAFHSDDDAYGEWADAIDEGNKDKAVAIIEKWAREHPETNMMTAKYALPRIDFKEGSDK